MGLLIERTICIQSEKKPVSFSSQKIVLLTSLPENSTFLIITQVQRDSYYSVTFEIQDDT